MKAAIRVASAGVLIGAACAMTVQLDGMYGTNAHGTADELGSFYATITVGNSPSQRRDFKVHIDTGSIGLALPAQASGARTSNSPVAGTEYYDTSASGTYDRMGGRPVACHSPDCDTRFQSDESLALGGHLALCIMKSPASEAYPEGFDICPRENTPEYSSLRAFFGISHTE